jgi:hypothetical protein
MKILLTDRRAMIPPALKVVYFLRTVWGIFLYSHTKPDPKQSTCIKKFLRHLPSTIVPSVHLKKFEFPLPHDQTSRSRIWLQISEKFRCGNFNAALNKLSHASFTWMRIKFYFNLMRSKIMRIKLIRSKLRLQDGNAKQTNAH